MKTANITGSPCSGWYNFKIPKTSPNGVSREILSVQEIADVMGEDEHVLKESSNRVNVSTYHVGNMNLVRRAELDRFLSQFPVKGFTKSPL